MKITPVILLLLVVISGCSEKAIEMHTQEEQEDNVQVQEQEQQDIEQSQQQLKLDINQSQQQEVKVEQEGEEPSEETDKLIMVHNGRGPMCLKQLKFLEPWPEKCPSLIIEEHLTTKPGTANILAELKSQYKTSEGVSDSFGYLPITFINEHAYSGFNPEVEQKLEKDILGICK